MAVTFSPSFANGFEVEEPNDGRVKLFLANFTLLTRISLITA